MARCGSPTASIPGWQTGDAQPPLEDPREPAPTPEEVGRGPLTERQGRFKAVRQVRDGVVLEYTAGGADVREWMTALGGRDGQDVVRHFEVGAASEPLWLLLGYASPATTLAACAGSDPVIPLVTTTMAGPELSGTGAARVAAVRVPPRADDGAAVRRRLQRRTAPACDGRDRIPSAPPAPRWPQEVTTASRRSTSKDPYVVDDFELPIDNPWRRNVRPGDIQFLKDGTGVLRHARWRRLARPRSCTSRRDRCAGDVSRPGCTSR